MKGGEVFLAHVIESSRKMVGLTDVEVFKEYNDVFPDDFSGLSPQHEVEFHIDLVLVTSRIAKAPYRLAH